MVYETCFMPASKISITLLLLCVFLMPFTVYQVGTVSGRNDLPTINFPTARPTINQPTARPTASFTRPVMTSISFTRSIATSFTQPALTSLSFTRSITSFTRPLTSISFTRSIATSFTFSTSQWTSISFTRTTVTSITFNPTFTGTSTAGYPTYGGFVFVQYPPTYNYNVGSFTLDQALIGQNGVPCTYYTYFEFNAYAGQQLQARVWTPGETISYIIIPQNLLPILQKMGCGYAQSNPHSQAHSFNSQVTLNWTAPQTTQYVIIFYSMIQYSGPIYFVPGPQ